MKRQFASAQSFLRCSEVMGYKWQKEKGSRAYRGALVREVTDALFRTDGQLHCYNPAGLSKAEAQPQAGNINNPTFKTQQWTCAEIHPLC